MDSNLFLSLNGLADGADGLRDVLTSLTRLGFKLGKNEINKYFPDLPLHYPDLEGFISPFGVVVRELPTGWSKKLIVNKTPYQQYILDEKENFRIRVGARTTLFPRFQLKSNAKQMVLLDEELRGSGSLVAAKFPIINEFYQANHFEIDPMIDTHLPNLRNPFDHWGQDRTRNIQSLQKELGILVQSTPKKAPTKKNLFPAP